MAQLRLIGTVHDPPVIQSILRHLGPVAANRGPAPHRRRRVLIRTGAPQPSASIGRSGRLTEAVRSA
jgi:hypothetical protein